ncbi:four helix bundle protein [Flagellimonas aequoris]|uniref:Four helix bundle protein n=1 Tax=Flagellimonas aequoris TaxID=2306997 RepID=A0A418N9V1_9FLAO|nr:four helix bundle protein [Allomuricauda aequoris]RIV72175.1 four helix bundle protein [Allomuricauda aequoris]TXK03946.1 four helix bundle protein [Allomuricauda aequoris]
MGRIDRFEDLEVWKISRELCQLVEQLFQTTPLGNNHALRNQMERSSGSIMDNIAEGFGRGGNKEFHNFLSFSKGSCAELKPQFYRSMDKKLISEDDFNTASNMVEHCTNKIGAFMYYLRNSNIKGQKFNSK